MALDRKYGRVSTERGTIGADEPVFIIRAQDRLAVGVLMCYAALCEAAGSPVEHLDGIGAAADEIGRWQEEHFHRTPGDRSERTDG